MAATTRLTRPSLAARGLSAREAAGRRLDAFCLQGRNLDEAEYAPLRAAMQQRVVLLACPEANECSDAAHGFFGRPGARVVAAAQNRTDSQMLMRVLWRAADDEAIARIEKRFAALGDALDARWRIESLQLRPRIAVFVSDELHCLAALLHEQRRGTLGAQTVH